MCTVCVRRELIKLFGVSSEWATCRLDFFQVINREWRVEKRVQGRQGGEGWINRESNPEVQFQYGINGTCFRASMRQQQHPLVQNNEAEAEINS